MMNSFKTLSIFLGAATAATTTPYVTPKNPAIPEGTPSVHEKVTVVEGVSIEGIPLSKTLKLYATHKAMDNGNLCWMNMGWAGHEKAAPQDPKLEACWKY